jgi:hypothetical protein
MAEFDLDQPGERVFELRSSTSADDVDRARPRVVSQDRLAKRRNELDIDGMDDSPATTDTAPRPHGRWFQFSLKSIFILVLIVASFLGGMAFKQREINVLRLELEVRGQEARKQAEEAMMQAEQARLLANQLRASLEQQHATVQTSEPDETAR